MTRSDIALETLYGKLHSPDWLDDLLVRSLKRLGEWSVVETILAAELLEDDDTLWDGGAFLGTFPLGVARRKSPKKVVAIEANRRLEAALAHNLSLLPCRSEIVMEGLGRRSGWLTPSEEDPGNHGATAYRESDTPPETGAAVACRTLEDIRAVHGDYDMLKLDLEGMELEALKGDIPYLKDRRPVIWAECNESLQSLHLLGGLNWLGYDVLYVAFPAFRRANFRVSDELIYPMAYEAALAAAPPARLHRLDRQAGTLVPDEDVICRKVRTADDLRRALFDTPRWSQADWNALSRAELIARLGRQAKNATMRSFLRD